MEERGTAYAKEHARAAGLRYVSDNAPGFQRQRRGSDFVYLNSRGRPIGNAHQVRRIRKLAIPPAWTDVWICPDPHGHLLATGRDARGRKQHRYHPRWREVRDETKFNRMIEFAHILPKIRRRTARDIAHPGHPKKKVLATIVRILETGLVRVGNEEYARQNNSYGLTTMRDRHVKVDRHAIRFEFRGKSGKDHQIELNDARLAKIVKGCQDIPGQELFQYIDDRGKRQKITSTDVNEYLRKITGADFTAKDFRTWAGTVFAAIAFREISPRERTKKNLKKAIENVAARLGNTPTICRKCYIHPFVLNAYNDENLLAPTGRARARLNTTRLNADEQLVLNLLQRSLAAQKKRESGGLLKQLQASIKHRKKAARCRTPA